MRKRGPTQPPGEVPEVPNRPGHQLEVLAWRGEFSPESYRSYYCTSSQIRVDPAIYPADVKAKLERGVAWEIILTRPSPERDPRTKSWEQVARHRVIMQLPESFNAWHLIMGAIREHFPRRAEIRTQVRYIDPATGATLRLVPEHIE